MQQNVFPLHIASAAQGLRHVFVRDLELKARIGIYDSEKGRTQRVRFNVDLTVRETVAELEDRFENVVCYEQVVRKIETILAKGHINLVETLAETVASACLEDSRVTVARVRIEKLEAIANAASVGVEIERIRLD